MTASRASLAILSVADKTGLDDIARALAGRGVVLVATGGTAAYLAARGIEVREIAAVTGAPAMLGGRVKALHPAVFAGLLAGQGDHRELESLGYAPVDYLIAGLAAAPTDAGDLSAMDVGGPAMIRAAVKAHDSTVLATSPEDYPSILDALAREGGVGPALRRDLARRAMERLLAYDAALLRRLAEDGPEAAAPLPPLGRPRPLRYGENPHQSADLRLFDGAGACAAAAERLQGRAPSFTNLLDADAAFELVRRFDRPAAVIVKHGAPCAVAFGDSLETAYLRAVAADPRSAFGGTVGLNGSVDAATMEAIVGRFTEAVVAPRFSDGALGAAAERAAMRVLAAGDGPPPAHLPDMRGIAGGLLVQTQDRIRLGRSDLTCRTVRSPTESELDDLLFALEVSRFVKSNAAVTARAGATVGIGGGQSSRVEAVELAVRDGAGRTGEAGLVLASDAFFPFPDSVEAAAHAGVTAIVQQGGARRDEEVVAAADRLGIAMLFCGMRLFRH